MKKIVGIVSVLLVVIMLSVALAACSGGYSVAGKYYKYNGDKKDESSWIELQSGKKWIDSDSEQGSYELDGDNITFSQDGIELFSGTLSKGVLTIKLFGISSVYKKDGATINGGGGTDGGADGGTDGGGGGTGGGTDGDGGGTIKPEPEEKAKVTAIEGGTVNKLNVNLEVSPTVENVDLSGMITVSKDSTWQLYKDITGQTLIPTKYAANLANGDNKLYIVVNSADGQINRTYTLNIWKNYEVIVTWKSNGQIYETTKEVTHTKLGAGTTLYREGYTFLGWGSTGHFVEKPVTFVADWSINRYTVTFKTSGGSTIPSKTIEYNSLATQPTDPTKAGFVFVGWFINSSSNTPFDFSAEITANTTLYAKWLEIFDLTFNANGGSVVDTQKVTDGSLATRPTAPTKTGFSFMGWYKEASLTTQFNFTTDKITADTTIYAKWATVDEYLTFTFTDSSNSAYSVAKKSGATLPEVIALPAEYNGKPVVAIGRQAFFDCSSLTSVTILASVTSIGNYAFEGCSSLTIYAEAASKPAGWVCWNPDNRKVVWGYNNITTNADYDYVVHNNEVYLTKYKGNALDVVIPATIEGKAVVSFGEIFKDNTTIKSLQIPAGVTIIGSSAFYNCSSLASVTFEAGSKLTTIGNAAFYGCSSLTSVTIPASVTSIGSSAFSGCSGLTSVTIPSSVTSIGERAFYNCSLLTSVTIPSSVTIIGERAFSGCSSLTSVTIPASVTSIGSSAFSGCSSLTSVTFEAGSKLTSIVERAFAYCSSLTSITIPASVTNIGSEAFRYCSSLTSITIPASVTNIGSEAFRYCSSLTSVTIPASVTNIGDFAFNNCSSLTIYAEVEEINKPASWHSRWNPDNRPVVWGHKI